MTELDTFIARVLSLLVNPAIGLLFAVAFMFFIVGIINFISNSDSPDAREKGRNNIIYGLIGMFVMMAAYGIIGIIKGTFGI